MTSTAARVACLALALACAVPTVDAQSAGAHVDAGDERRARRDLVGALERYEAALSLDAVNYAALWKASDAAVILGEFDPNPRRRDSLYAVGERYARRAVAANAAGADGHFVLAQALGRMALTVPLLDRAKHALEIRERALAALAADSLHAGAIHVLGMWHQNVMRLGLLQRMAARLLAGVRIDASWNEAQSLLEKAAALEPHRIVHRLDLGLLYAERKMNEKAQEQFMWIRTAPATEYNDPHYKREAERAASALRGRVP